MNLIEIKNDTAFADSLQIAEHFGKEHSKVLRSIENILKEKEEFGKPKVASQTYENRGKKYSKYLLDRDMFSLIIMGFTGKKALDWKIKYIEAFNKMEDILVERKSTDWQLTRENGKITRRGETDSVKAFCLYAEGQGSKNFKMYYKHFTALVHKSLGIKDGDRENLTIPMLTHVATFENQISALIEKLINQDNFYKDIYQEIKARINLLSSMMILPNNKYLPSPQKYLEDNKKVA